jgi:hypothetical protein
MMLICASVAACAQTAADSDKRGIQIPRDCEELAQPVPEPDWRKGQNAKVLLGRTTGALIQANENLDATRTCQAKQRETFAHPSRVTE